MTDDKDVEEPIESDSIPGKAEENSINVSHETPMEVNEDSIFSLDLWVQECEGHQDNPVLFYKPSNNPMKGFSVGDFCLIVMTSFQADMLRRYPDIIAIDSTYGLEDYEFELTTVMIIDKKGELFPVAFMFTNNENKSISTLFFGHVKEKVGSICPQIFISEMTGKFHESWSESMGTISNWLFCSCHLEHIWKLNLLNVKCRDKRVWIYETLKELQLTSEEEKFINNLDSAINELLRDEDTFAFGEAFQNSYLDCVRQWVYCYRKDLGLEADIFLDSMKKMLRYPGSKKKFKKRDKIVYDILKYVRDKTVTCIVEEAEGDLKHEFNQNHDQSVQNIFDVMKCTEEFWVIKKEGEDNKFHSVEILSNTKCCDVTCCKCDICVHMYSCSCPTYFINSIICEHIHYIATNHPISKNQLKEEETDSVVEMEEEGESVNTGSNSNCLPNISRIANETIVKLQNANYDTMSKDVSSQLLPHLLAMNKLLTLLEKRKR